MPLPPDEAPIPGRRGRILIADDDPGTRELLTGLVTELGHEPLGVSDGDAALEAVTAELPDLPAF